MATSINTPTPGTVLNGEIVSEEPASSKKRATLIISAIAFVLSAIALCIGAVSVVNALVSHENSVSIGHGYVAPKVQGHTTPREVPICPQKGYPAPGEVPDCLSPKDPSQDPVQQGNAPIGGGANGSSGSGQSQPNPIEPPAGPRVNPPVPPIILVPNIDS